MSVTSAYNTYIVRGLYRHACPNCGGTISDLRLLYKAPCEECLPEDVFQKIASEVAGYSRVKRLKIYAKYINKALGEGLAKLIKDEEELDKFEKFFVQATGFSMWSAQRTWARRLLRGESFSIIAPTGMGKTVFSLIATLYAVTQSNSGERGKAYLAFPTTPLLLQSWKKLIEFARNAKLEVCSEEKWDRECLRVAYVHSKMNKKSREFMLEKIKSGDFDILLTTSAFMHRHIELIPKGVYTLVVMDDVDSVLKSGTAVRRLLSIIGLHDEHIDRGLELLKTRARIATLATDEAEKIRSQLEKLEVDVEAIRRNIKTTLIVNSATGRPRGIYPKLFKVFLGFEAGSKPEAIRNIIDTYTIPDSPRTIEDLVRELALKLRDGFLIFIPIDRGVEYAEYLAAKLRDIGIKAEAFHAKRSAELIEAFARGEYNCLVGVATYYGTIVRGVDLPTRVKYVVFAGVPRHKFSSKLETLAPLEVLRMLIVIRDVVESTEREEIDTLIGRLSRRLRIMSQGALMKLREEYIKALSTGVYDEKNAVLRDLLRASEILRKKLSEKETWNKLSKLGEVAITKEGESMYILIPDVATYIQASGRCSRLYPGGITKGLSVIIVDDERLLRGLVSRMRWIFEDFKIYELREVDLESIIKEISEERIKVAEILDGKIAPTAPLELVKTVLFIVESPNKARTIANFFGKPSVRIFENNVKAYEVTIGKFIVTIIATGGHVYELIVDEKPREARNLEHLYGVIKKDEHFIPIYTDIKTCIRGHQFTNEVDDLQGCPKCEFENKTPYMRKLKVIEVLRRLASEVDTVLIGTDPDAEGEKIAWDIRVLLEPYAEGIYRVEFHEVTRRAILNALSNPGDFDIKRVEAQIVRRVDDRWLGFALSGVVQSMAWPIYCAYYLHARGKVASIEECCEPNRNLSAGRVQTPVLGFITSEFEKSKDIKNSKYIIHIVLEVNRELDLALNYEEARSAGIVSDSGRIAKTPIIVEVEILEEKLKEITPLPPYTTDTLLEDASRRLGFSTSKTMSLAQDLFEWGLITYHRTDSTRVSDIGIEIARQYLEYKYGDSYQALFKPRTWGIGGAHEAIRPTRPIDADRLYELVREGALVVLGRFTKDHARLYDLIFRRFIASQMRTAQVLSQKLRVKINSFTRELEILCEPLTKGYLELYSNLEFLGKFEAKPDKKTISGSVDIEKTRRIQYPLPRFHDVIKWMKENGIGRPSTYAKIIDTLLERKYVEVVGRNKALLVTERGKFIYEFLQHVFANRTPNIVSTQATRDLENMMDEVERGKKYYQEVLGELYRQTREEILSEKAQKIILEKLIETLRIKYSELSNKGLVLDYERIEKCIIKNAENYILAIPPASKIRITEHNI